MKLWIVRIIEDDEDKKKGAGQSILFLIPIVNLVISIIGFIASFREKGLTIKIVMGALSAIVLALHIFFAFEIVDLIQERQTEKANEQMLYDSSLLEINIEDKTNIDGDTFSFGINYKNNNWNRIVGCDIEFAVYNHNGVELLKTNITQVDCFENQEASYNYSVDVNDPAKANELYNTAYEYLEIHITIKMLDYNSRVQNYEFDDHRVLKTIDAYKLESAYTEAVAVYNNGEYDKAIEKFSLLGTYKESSTYLNNSYNSIKNNTLEEVYITAKELYNQKQYSEAYKSFSEIKDYKDSESFMSAIINDVEKLALEYADDGDYESAYNLLIDMGFSTSSEDQNYLPILNAYHYAAKGAYKSAVFYGLTKITIPNGVTEIGDFQGCTEIVEVIMPDSITEIGDYCFSGCTSLTTLKLSSNIQAIGNYAFSGCTALTAIELPSNIKSIGMNAFSNCDSLEKIILPTSLESISVKGWNSFDGEIHYAGTIEQWENISKDHLFMATLNKTIYCSNGNVEP